MGRLLLLFVALPALELALLIELGSRIGTGATLALIAVTGVVGASLARRQGLGVIRELQRETDAGRLPAGALVDGVILLVAAALLVTPGVVTDAVGFLCLVPAFRQWVKRQAFRRFEGAVREGRVHVVHVDGGVAGGTPWEPRVEKEVHDVREPRGPDAPRRDGGSRWSGGGPGAG